MSSYCEFSDLQSRLTVAGLEWAANRDGGDTLTSDEVTRYVTPAILRADTEIDAAIQQYYDLTLARGNAWLKYIAIDLACVEAITNGGRTAPDNYVASAKRARDTLKLVTTGQQRIPGLARLTTDPYVTSITLVDLQNA